MIVEDLDSVPSTHGVAHSQLWLQFQGTGYLLISEAADMHMIHVHTHAGKTIIYKNKYTNLSCFKLVSIADGNSVDLCGHQQMDFKEMTGKWENS